MHTDNHTNQINSALDSKRSFHFF